MEMRKHGAIDIGSNSIKLLVGFLDPAAGLQVVSREKENVRLGRETFRTGRLSAETVAAGAAAVARLAGLAKASGAEIVRAVATCAVREAANAAEFVAAVRESSGIEVDVISGDEEARLVTLGVRSALPASCDPFFLIDIGGGSTELVVGDGERILLAESLPIGVVRLAEEFLGEDPVSPAAWKAARKFIRQCIGEPARRVRKLGFRTCVGSSGSVQSLAMVHEAAIRGREPFASGFRTLSRKGLRRVNRLLRRTTLKEKLRVPGLDPKRRDIALAGGAILAEILRACGADEVLTGERGLREGILLDSAGRRRRGTAPPVTRDVREASVEQFARRWNVELPHARQVARLADEIFESTHALHQMTPREREWLRFASLLHDAGGSVRFRRHHRHSYYLIMHGEFTGLSAEEIETIAVIARYHRGARPKDRHPEWRALDPWRRRSVEKLAAILRIADGFDRGHAQVVERAGGRLRRKKIVFDVFGRGDVAAEIEAAERKSGLFRRVFDRKVIVRSATLASKLRVVAGKEGIA